MRGLRALLTIALFPLLPILPAAHADGFEFRFKPTADTRVIEVASLQDSGLGTLRACVESSGPRVCVFSVAGVLALNRPIKAREPMLLIAGETAPPPGITLTGAGLKIETHHVEVRHLAIRPGDSPLGAKPADRDGVSIGAEPPASAHHVSLSHLSLTWAVDENLSAWYPTTHDISVSDSIIAEGLQDSIHPKGPHSKGVLIGRGVRRLTLQRNLLAFNEERNPYVEPGASAKLINNLVYGWGPRGPWSICNITNNDNSNKPLRVALVGNVFLPGPRSFIGSAPVWAKRLAPASLVFAQDNQWLGHLYPGAEVLNIPSAVSPSLQCPFSSGCGPALAASATEASVLQRAGSRPAQRSEPDQRIVAAVRARTGELKDCLVGCRRPAGSLKKSPPRYRSLSPPSRPAGDEDGDGTSNLEEWLDRFIEEVEKSLPETTRDNAPSYRATSQR